MIFLILSGFSFLCIINPDFWKWEPTTMKGLLTKYVAIGVGCFWILVIVGKLFV